MVPIGPICRINMLRLATTLAKARGVKLSTISRQCHSDPAMLDSFKAKKVSISHRKFDSGMQWFEDNWPDDLEWPPLEPYPAPDRNRRG